MGYVARGGEGEEGTLQGEGRGRRVRCKGRGGGGGYTAKGGEGEEGTLQREGRGRRVHCKGRGGGGGYTAKGGRGGSGGRKYGSRTIEHLRDDVHLLQAKCTLFDVHNIQTRVDWGQAPKVRTSGDICSVANSAEYGGVTTLCGVWWCDNTVWCMVV